MPTLNQHLSQAESNERFAEGITALPTRFPDWEIIALFYSALHYADAFLATQEIHPGSHDSRIASVKLYIGAWEDYRHLYRLSLSRPVQHGIAHPGGSRRNQGRRVPPGEGRSPGPAAKANRRTAMQDRRSENCRRVGVRGQESWRKAARRPRPGVALHGHVPGLSRRMWRIGSRWRRRGRRISATRKWRSSVWVELSLLAEKLDEWEKIAWAWETIAKIWKEHFEDIDNSVRCMEQI